MQERDIKEAQAKEQAFRSYVQDAATTSGGGGTADELSKLADLRDRGVITPEEFGAAEGEAARRAA